MASETEAAPNTESGSSVAGRARRGVGALLARQAITFPIGFISSVLLARMLGPADFGAYTTVSFVVMGVGALFEMGLGAVLIQQPEDPSPAQLRTIFTVYLCLFSVLTAGVMALAAPLAATFHLPPEGTGMLRAMSLHMVLGAFGSISTLLMERRMAFGEFARLDVANILLDRAVTLSLAFFGWGPWSFVVGSLVSSMTRVIMLVTVAPWPWGLAWDRPTLRRVLGKGALFQGINLFYLWRENITTLLGGTVFGPREVGLLNWGQNLPSTVTQNFILILLRVSFPAFARLQDDAPERQRLLTDGLRALNFVTLPLLALLVVLGNPIVTLVYGEAWRPALFALECYVFRNVAMNFVSPMIGYLNGTGRVDLSFRITVAWTLAEWGLSMALIPWLGFYAVAVGTGLGILLPTALLWLEVQREFALPFRKIVGEPAAIAFLACAVALCLGPWLNSFVTLMAGLTVAMAVALAAGVWLERERLRAIVLPWLASRGPAR